MEKPYAQVKMNLTAPYEEMVDVVVSALRGHSFRIDNYTETPSTIQASLQEAETWGGRRFSSDYLVELNWKKIRSQ